MFKKLLYRLFGRSTEESAAAAEQIVQHVSGDLPAGPVPADQMLCIFQQGRLVNYYRDDDPPGRRSEESWWLVPGNDLVLTIRLEVGDETFSIDVSVRFEAEAELLNLLDSQENLTRDDLVSLVTSQLAGLMDMLGLPTDGSLLESTAGNQERIRAKLSLMLQNQGLRCTDVSNWQLVEQTSLATEQASEEDAESTADLVEAVQQVNQADQWDGLMATLEASGCEFDLTAAEELDKLGKQVLERNIAAEKVASRLGQLAQQARHRAGIPQPELQRWRGLDMRLNSNLTEESVADDPEAERQLQVSRKRRPWTWWLLTQRGVDDRLLQFLDQTLSHLRNQFDSYRTDKSMQQGLVQLRRIDQRLDMALDLIKTVPTLRPQQSSLRIDRTRLKPLVRHVEGAVTAVETVQTEIKSMQKQSTGGEKWIQSSEAICEALDHLNNQLRQRRQVRTSVEI